jgi:adenylate cyclase
MATAGSPPANGPGDHAPAQAAPEAVRAQLDRIVASPDFVVPERARKFLRYVVEEALAGRADHIKAYTIAVDVFGRNETFDSQSDPVVRIEAGRLRRALERYYLTAGRADPIVIGIPKGGYVPTFTCRVVPKAAEAALPAQEAEAEAAVTPPETTVTPPGGGTRRWRIPTLLLAGLTVVAAVLGLVHLLAEDVSRPAASPPAAARATLSDGPSLLVVPFEELDGEAATKLYAAGLTEELLTQLARFKELTVLGRETARSVPARADPTWIGRNLAVRYMLAGGVRVAGGQVRVTSRLLDTRTGTILWTQTYEDDLHAKGLLAVEEDIARQVVTAVAQPYGIIFRTDLQRTAGQRPEDLEAYACTLRFYTYRTELDPQQHAPVRACLERAAARFPTYATAWAMLSLLYLDEDRFGYDRAVGQPAPLERALAAARRAVELDPENARALQALMIVLFFRQDVAEALRVGERAVALNPNDTELLAEFGTRLAFSGAWERGGKLVEEALARNPAHSGYYSGTLALIDYMRRDYDRAVAEIRRANLEKFSIYHGVAAIIYAQVGLLAEARAAAARFRALHPGFLRSLDAELAKRNFRPEDRARLIDGLRKAGLPVPEIAAGAVKPAGS